MLGRTPDEPWNSKFQNRHIEPKIIDTINQHLEDQRESYMYADENQTTEDDTKIDFLLDKEQAVCNILRKHEGIWSGELS